MNQRKAGIVLSYLCEAIKIISALIYTPLMLRLLGQSEYGLYQLVSSTVSYLSLLSLGFGSAYVRYFSRYQAKKDSDGITRLNGMFLIVFTIMSAVCILCGSVMLGNARVIFGDGLTGAELETAKRLFRILLVNMAMTFPNSVFDCYIIAHERFVFQRFMSLLQSLLNPFLTLPLLLLGYGSVAMVVISTALTATVFLSNIVYCRKKLAMAFSFRGLQYTLLREMWGFTLFIFLHQIIDQLNWNVDKMLLGRFCGTAAVAVYGIGGQINSVYMSITNKIPSVFIPEVNRIVMENKEDCDKKLSALLNKVGRITFILALYVFVGFVFCGRNFVRIWAGKEYIDAYYVTLLLIAPLVLILPHGLGIEIRRAKNKHRLAAVIMLITTIGNALISIPLSKEFGAIGAAAGTFCCLLGNRVIMDYYYIHVVALDVRILHNSMKHILKKSAIPVMFGLCGLFFSNVYVNLLWAAVYSALYFGAIYSVAVNEEEKVILRRALARIRGIK